MMALKAVAHIQKSDLRQNVQVGLRFYESDEEGFMFPITIAAWRYPVSIAALLLRRFCPDRER